MREGFRNFITGLVGIFALLGFAFLLMRFGELDSLRSGRWPLVVVLNDAGGLREGSTVALNGVPIGLVDSIAASSGPEFDPRYPVAASLLIEPEYSIPRHVTTTIQGSLIGGSAVLRLETDPTITDFDALLARDGSARLSGTFESLGAQLATSIGRELGPLTEGFGDLRTRIESLLETYTQLGRDLDDLVAPLSQDELAEGTAANLRITIRQLNAALSEARDGMAGIRRWTDDETLRSDFQATLGEARATVTEVRAVAGRFGELAEGVQRDASRLVDRLVPAADELSATLADVRGLVATARSPQGSLGLFLTRPDVYNAMLDSAIRLDRALAEAELLLKKIRQEGLSLDL